MTADDDLDARLRLALPHIERLALPHVKERKPHPLDYAPRWTRELSDVQLRALTLMASAPFIGGRVGWCHADRRSDRFQTQTITALEGLRLVFIRHAEARITARGRRFLAAASDATRRMG